VFIPKTLHEHFECVIGKHVFIDNPWTKISRKKIIDNLQSQNTDSCFWQFQNEIEVKANNSLFSSCIYYKKYYIFINTFILIFLSGHYK